MADIEIETGTPSAAFEGILLGTIAARDGAQGHEAAAAAQAMLAGTAADRAGLALAGTLAAGRLYATPALGAAATAEAGFFFVMAPNGQAFARLWRVVGGAAVDQAIDLPSLTGASDMAQLANELPEMRRVLRRASSNANPDSKMLRARAATLIQRAKHTASDGTTVWLPDSGGTYTWVWNQDSVFTMMHYADWFTADQIKNVYLWYKRNSPNAPLGRYPDHIGLDGVAYAGPGYHGEYGSREPVASGAYMVHLAWLYTEKSGDPSLYLAERDALLAILNVGTPYDPAGSGCVYVDPAAPFVDYGFTDNIEKTGCVAAGSVFMFEAARMICDMASRAGDMATALACYEKSKSIQTGANTVLWAPSISTAGDTNNGIYGLYKTSTGKCSAQFDVWGSLLAVYTGMATPEIARAISKTMANAVSATTNGKPEVAARGQVRHVLRSNDYIADVQCWEAFTRENPHGSPFDTYQNGGYWSKPSPWMIFTLSITDKRKAFEFYRDFAKAHNKWFTFDNPHWPYEWTKWDDSQGGATGFLISCANILACDPAWWGGGQTPDRVVLGQRGGGNSIGGAGYQQLGTNLVIEDDLGSVIGQTITVPYTDRYDAVVSQDMGASPVAASRITLAVFVNGQMRSKVGEAVQADTTTGITVMGQSTLDLAQGDVVDLRIATGQTTPIGVDPSVTSFRLTRAGA